MINELGSSKEFHQQEFRVVNATPHCKTGEELVSVRFEPEACTQQCDVAFLKISPLSRKFGAEKRANLE
jgi:hypothetical protein